VSRFRTQLKTLSGRIRIQASIDRIVTLFVATDNKDWQTVRHCSASSVHFDMSSLSGTEPVDLTPAEIAEAWEQGLAPIEEL
jgi:hypothetical protein